MRSRSMFLALVLSATLLSSGARAGNFGNRKVAEEVTLGQVVKNPSRYSGKLVRLTGTISDVCKKKGCWMVLGEGPESIRVKFEDYSFFVPMDSTAKQATIEGTLEAVELSDEEVAHLAAEAKKSPGSIQKRTVEFTASGVLIEGYRDEAPPARKPRKAGSGSSED